MTKIVNLTPHPIKLFGAEGEEIVIEPTGKPVRLEEKVDGAGFLPVDTNIGRVRIPVVRKTLGKLIGMPEPEAGMIFIVSLPVAQVAKRDDVLTIGESVRDEKGNIVGAKSLAAF